MTTETEAHEHDFVSTYVRTLGDGRRLIIYAGERDDDEVVLMCDGCGEEKPAEKEEA